MEVQRRHGCLAEAMRGLLRCPGLLSDEQIIPTPGDCYRTVLLWSDTALDLSLLALVWSCGQRTAIMGVASENGKKSYAKLVAAPGEA